MDQGRRPARLRYDFAGYDLGDDTVAAIEEAVRGVLREAFAAYAAEGCWTVSDDGARLVWEPDPDAQGQADPEAKGQTHWGGEFPIELALSPADFVDAWSRRIARRATGSQVGRRRPPGPEARAEILAAMGRWRGALDQVERAIRAAATGGNARE